MIAGPGIKPVASGQFEAQCMILSNRTPLHLLLDSLNYIVLPAGVVSTRTEEHLLPMACKHVSLFFLWFPLLWSICPRACTSEVLSAAMCDGHVLVHPGTINILNLCQRNCPCLWRAASISMPLLVRSNAAFCFMQDQLPACKSHQFQVRQLP